MTNLIGMRDLLAAGIGLYAGFTVPGSADIHDVTVNKGQLYGVDAGEHPGWSIDVPDYQQKGYPPLNSPTGCQIFKIDLI